MEKAGKTWLDDFGRVFAPSGTLNFFGQGWPHHETLRLVPGFGFDGYVFVSKTTPFNPRPGNMPSGPDHMPLERYPECIRVYPFAGAAMNAVGLTSPGFTALLGDGRWQARTEPFFISYMATEEDQDERIDNAKQVRAELGAALPDFRARVGLEINMSCPNVGAGRHCAVDNDILYLETFRGLGAWLGVEVPIVVKISPMTLLEYVVEIVRSGVCGGLTVGNTVHWDSLPDELKKKYFRTLASPLAKFGGGAASGNPIRGIALSKIASIRNMGIGLPIIGGGGLTKPGHVDLFADAGADAVAVGTAGLVRPWNLQPIRRRAERIFRR